MAILATIVQAQPPAPKPAGDNGSDTAILVAYVAVLISISGRRSRCCPWRRKPKAPQPTA